MNNIIDFNKEKRRGLSNELNHLTSVQRVYGTKAHQERIDELRCMLIDCHSDNLTCAEPVFIGFDFGKDKK